MECQGFTSFLFILIFLTDLQFSATEENGNLDVVFLTDNDNRLGISNIDLMREFIKDVAFEVFGRRNDTYMAVADTRYYWYSHYWYYGYYGNSFQMNYTSFENVLDNYWNISSYNYSSRRFYYNLYHISYYWHRYRIRNNTELMIYMISDGYHHSTKEAAHYVLNDGTKLAAIIRTDNETEVEYMENATGDPLLVTNISSYYDLTSLVQPTINTILTGKGDASGIPDYEILDVNITFSLLWENDIPFLVFSCDYNISATTNLVHSIQWYIDGNPFGRERLFYPNETIENTLSEQALTNAGHHHGITLKCRVGAMYTYEGRRGKTKSSSFFAGLEVLTKRITLKEEDEATITLRPTVPVACENSTKNCSLHVRVENPNSLNCKESRSGIQSQRCRVIITGHTEATGKAFYLDEGNWKREYNLTVTNSKTTDWTKEYFYTVALRTSADHHGFWNYSQVSNIPVNIDYSGSLWRGAYCYSHIDPHMMTFDFRHYEQQKRAGKYLMYRHKTLDQEVQYETQYCYFNDRSPYCVCSLAVRAGRDVFLIDLCRGSRFINFVTCTDHTLTIESDSYSMYKITFPSGTQVHARMFWCWSSSCFMNVDIYPTASDFNATEGLCGVFDDDCNNDFVKRDGSYDPITTNNECPPPYSYIFPNDFSESWSLTDEENLLPPLKRSVYENLKPWSLDLLVCFCVFEDPNLNRPSTEVDKVDCSYQTYRDCSDNRYRKFTCDIKRNFWNGRRKRSIRSLRNESSAMEKELRRKEISKRSATMSDDEARRHCNSTFHNSTMYRLCMETVEEMDDSHYENCVLDVKATGDVSLARVALQIVKDICLTIIGKNTTLNDSAPDVVQAVKAQACPEDCNEKGTCIEGICDCDVGFGGDDCSNELSSPPTVDGADDEVCDLREDTCDSITLLGDNFFSLTPRCRIDVKEIHKDGTEYDLRTVINDGEQKSQFEAVCHITGSRSKRSVVYGPAFVRSYIIAISNDNDTFSDNATVYVYDSLCQDRDPYSRSFTLKKGYCFIDGSCYSDGSVDPVTKAQTCCSAIDSFSWQSLDACDETDINEVQNTDGNTVLIIVIVVAIALVVIITSVLIYLKTSSSKRHEKGVKPMQIEINMPCRSEKQGKDVYKNYTMPPPMQPPITTQADFCTGQTSGRKIERPLSARSAGSIAFETSY